MADKKSKAPKVDKSQQKLQQQVEELTSDLQRTRADFENYRNQVDTQKQQARGAGKMATVIQLLPVVDNIERAIGHCPHDLREHKWAEGVIALSRQLDKQLSALGVERIKAETGSDFNPGLHEAIQFDEDSEGEREVIAEELQHGYMLDGVVIRHTMVKVTRQ